MSFFLCCFYKFANVFYEGRYRLCFTDYWQFSFVSKRKTNCILSWMVYSFINYSSRPMRRAKSLSLSKTRKKRWWKYDPWLVNNSAQSHDMLQPKNWILKTTYHLPVCFCNVHVCPVSDPLSAVTSINTGATSIETLTHTDRGVLH